MLVERISPLGAGSNVYLVHDVLIDVGMDAQRVIEHLEGRSVALRMVVLTHAHFDHTAALEEVVEHTGALVAMGEHDAEYLADPVYSVAEWFGGTPPRITPDIMLSDGDEIRAGDTVLEVLSTPGHTKGSICLFEPERASLFSGDTVYADGGFGRCDLPGGNREDLLRTLQRLSVLDVHRLYPGHGRSVEERAFEHIKLAYQIACSVFG